MNILKFIAATFIGLTVAIVLIFVLETFGHSIYPPPQGVDLTDKDVLAEMIKNAPIGALLIVVAAYFVGSFVGGLIAQLINRHAKLIDALVVGFILMIFGIFNLTSIPHPLWMVVLGILVFIPGAYIGGKLVKRKN